MFNNSIGDSIIRLTLAAKGEFFAAGSKFVYWNKILDIKGFSCVINHSF